MITIETFTRSSISATVEGHLVYSLPKFTAMALQTVSSQLADANSPTYKIE